MDDKQENQNISVEEAAEKWVKIVMAQIQANKLQDDKQLADKKRNNNE